MQRKVTPSFPFLLFSHCTSLAWTTSRSYNKCLLETILSKTNTNNSTSGGRRQQGSLFGPHQNWLIQMEQHQIYCLGVSVFTLVFTRACPILSCLHHIVLSIFLSGDNKQKSDMPVFRNPYQTGKGTWRDGYSRKGGGKHVWFFSTWLEFLRRRGSRRAGWFLHRCLALPVGIRSEAWVCLVNKIPPLPIWCNRRVWKHCGPHGHLWLFPLLSITSAPVTSVYKNVLSYFIITVFPVRKVPPSIIS